MIELLVFEPSSEREQHLLRRLKNVHAQVKVVKDFNVLCTQLDEPSGQIFVVDVDFIPQENAPAFWNSVQKKRPLLRILGVSEKDEAEWAPLIVETGVLITPLHHSWKLDLGSFLRRLVAGKNEMAPVLNEEPVEFIGRSEAVKRILEQAEMLANSESNILITGETGSGKTLLAKYIHFKSARRHEPFFHINCAAIPEQLLEAELFGYKKGAFTGALKDTEGKFKAARRGTILLDEIGEMPVHLQAKLLKVLDENQYYPIGGTQLEFVEARIIAATNKNILQEIAEKRFRMDLYYRLNSFEINIPALRERPEDISLLFDHFLRQMALKNNDPEPQVEPAVYEVIRAYDWPGNTRELQNLTQVLMHKRPQKISVEMLPEKFFSTFASEMIKKGEEFSPLDEIKKSYARYILGRTQGNKSKAAKILRVDIKTFNKLLA